MGFRVISLHHVQITVPREREAAALAFYRDLLGLPEVPQPDAQARRGGAWFRLPGLEIHLKPEDTGADAALASKRHICLAVDDLSACRTALHRAGVELLPDERPIPGVARFFVRDPGGNRVEIMQG